MRLEGLVRPRPRVLADGWRIDGGVLDFLPLLGRLADGMAPAAGAELFHGTLIAGLVEWAAAAASTRGLRTVALSGGCFLNKVLSEGLVAGLNERGLEPLVARAVPPNDGGLSLGQAYVAASALLSGRTARRGDLMCHALPVKIVALTGPETAKVSLGGIVKEISVALIDDPKTGRLRRAARRLRARQDRRGGSRTHAGIAGGGRLRRDGGIFGGRERSRRRHETSRRIPRRRDRPSPRRVRSIARRRTPAAAIG